MAYETKVDAKKIDKEKISDDAFNNLDEPTQILDYLESKQTTVKLYQYLSMLMRQTPIGKHSTLTDYLIPGLPLNMFGKEWDGSVPSGYFAQFPHRSLLPTMISPEIRNIDKEDPIAEIIYKKRNWFQGYGFKISKCKARNRKVGHKWLSDDVLYCPKYYVDVIQSLESDPDEYFNCKYNWYYAGKGNLHLVTIGGSDYLLHSEFYVVYLTPFYKDNNKMDYNYSVSYKCDENENIFETIYNNNCQIIALRTKYKVILLKVEITDESLKMEKVKEVKSDWSFTSITFDEHHKNILYLTTIENEVIIINLDRMMRRTVKLKGKLKTICNNWSTVLSAQRECYLHAWKKTITLYDKRTNEACERWKSLAYLTDSEGCSAITAATYCMRRPQLYVGTAHHLFLLDMRFSKLNKKPTAIQRWTHGMQVPPTYFSICANAEYNRDMICFSSQWPEDMSLLLNHSDILDRREHLNCIYMPYRPPGLLETYKKAKTNGLCNNYLDIKDRLLTTTSGIAMYQQDDNYVVLMQNSLGDISRHMLYPHHRINSIEDDSPLLLNEWNFNMKSNEELVYTHVMDVRQVWNRLRKIPDDFFLGRKIHKNQNTQFDEKEIYDTFQKGEVDPQFLEIWKTADESLADISMEDTQSFSLNVTGNNFDNLTGNNSDDNLTGHNNFDNPTGYNNYDNLNQTVLPDDDF